MNWAGPIGALALATVSAAAAAPQQADPPADIVVTAQQAAEREKEARDFVRQVSPLAIDGQFARWHTPLCPIVLGPAAPVAARVVRRIRQRAAEVGAPVAEERCRANAFVVFTPDARALLKTMERREPRLLSDLALPERRALRESDAPMLWWNNSHSEGADGNPLMTMTSAALGPIGTAGPAIPVGDRTRFGDSYRSSMVSTAVRVTIAGAVVLVDVPRSTGIRLDAIADHAAFVILARVRPTAPAGAVPTILTLFTAAENVRPAELTAADRPAAAQARAIAASVARRN